MSDVETVRVVNPKKPGTFRIIEKAKYDADPAAYILEGQEQRQKQPVRQSPKQRKPESE